MEFRGRCSSILPTRSRAFIRLRVPNYLAVFVPPNIHNATVTHLLLCIHPPSPSVLLPLLARFALSPCAVDNDNHGDDRRVHQSKSTSLNCSRGIANHFLPFSTLPFQFPLLLLFLAPLNRLPPSPWPSHARTADTRAVTSPQVVSFAPSL